MTLICQFEKILSSCEQHFYLFVSKKKYAENAFHCSYLKGYQPITTAQNQSHFFTSKPS